jgi:hypothetical protein
MHLRAGWSAALIHRCSKFLIPCSFQAFVAVIWPLSCSIPPPTSEYQTNSIQASAMPERGPVLMRSEMPMRERRSCGMD